MSSVIFIASRISHILNFHMPYIEHFKQRGYSIHIAAQGAGDDPRFDKAFDIKFTKKPWSPDNIKAIFKLKKILCENNYELVCSNTTLAGAAAKAAAMLCPRKNKPRLFVHISHGYMFDSSHALRPTVYRTVEKLTKRAVDRLVVMNDEDLHLAEKYRLCRDIHFIHGMGLDVNRFPDVSDDMINNFRRKYCTDSNTKLLLCIGELSARKNQQMLIRVAARLKDRNIKLLLAGDGDKKTELQSLAATLGCQDKVCFLGYRTDTPLLYRGSDILLSASTMEGLPFNVLEALYCGLPVCLSDIKGHRDLVKSCGCGELFSLDDDSLVKTLLHFTDDAVFYSKQKESTALSKVFYLDSVKPVLIPILENKEIM